MAKAHILLVDGDADARRVLKVSLEQAGFAVAAVSTGDEALTQLASRTPSLLIAATDLPGVDGYALVGQLRQRPEWRALPIIFLSTSESIENKIRGLELGVDDYLIKPVLVGELCSRIDGVLAKQLRQHLSGSAAETRVLGRLEDLSPLDLVRSLSSAKQTGVLALRSGDYAGQLHFRRGDIVDAKLKKLRGEEAAFRMLTWREGTFEVEFGPVHVTRIVEGSTQALVSAAMRHTAEYGRLLDRLPPLHAVFEVDGARSGYDAG